jgi:hypothetical protein
MWLFAPQGHPHHLSIQAAMSGFVWQSSLPRGSRKGLTEASYSRVGFGLCLIDRTLWSRALKIRPE